MKINKEVILKLNPCQDRIDNYLKFYDNKEFTKAQFMGLKNITHDDKIWVALRLISKENAVLAAADIAESVLHLFEQAYPNDDRPRKAIEAARDKNMSYEDKCKAANATRGSAVRAGAGAFSAAYYAAGAASYAAGAASYAEAYYAAIYANTASSLVINSPGKLIRKICLKYWK